MKKKWTAALGLALAAATALSAGVYAADPVTHDDFSDQAALEKWVVDNFEPEDFYIQSGVGYLAVGDNGYRRNRPDEQKDKSYAQQGYKLKTAKVSAEGWTASVKLQVDDTWYGVRQDKDIKQRAPKVENQKILDNKKKATFRVDLRTGDADAPAITFIKGGDGAPAIKYYDPKEPQSWGTASFTWPGEETSKSSKSAKTSSEAAAADPDGWLTLTITCRSGAVTYYIDGQKIGAYQLENEKAIPGYLSLSMQNFERPDVTAWDDVRLYNGVEIPQK